MNGYSFMQRQKRTKDVLIESINSISFVKNCKVKRGKCDTKMQSSFKIN